MFGTVGFDIVFPPVLSTPCNIIMLIGLVLYLKMDYYCIVLHQQMNIYIFGIYIY